VSDEPQIAALRDDIRRAGQNTRIVRLVVAAGVFTPLAALLAAVAYLSLPVWGGWLGWTVGIPVWIFALLTFGGVFCLLSGLVALPFGVARRALHRRRLGSRLAVLAPTECAHLLRSLEQERLDDTRKLAASLLRDFGGATELTPATLPNARGDEASPAEPKPRGTAPASCVPPHVSAPGQGSPN